MRGSSKTCDEHQVELEMARRGVLDASATAALEEHLRGCVTCRQLEALARRTEDTMQTQTEAALSTVSWERLEKRIARERTWLRVLPWLALTLFLGQGALLAALFTPDRFFALWAQYAAAGLVFTVWIALETRARANRTLAAQREGIEALARHRREEVGKKMSDARLLRALGPLAALILIGLAAAPRKRFAALLLLGSAICLMGVGAWYHLVQLPRLRREQAELG